MFLIQFIVTQLIYNNKLSLNLSVILTFILTVIVRAMLSVNVNGKTANIDIH